MSRNLKNKTALVTGAASGLGKRIAIDLARGGYDVVINYRGRQKEAELLVDEIRRDFHVNASSVYGDVSRPNDVQQMAEEVFARHATVDILVHAVGPFIYEYKKLMDYSREEWSRMIDGNLSSAFYLFKAFVPAMRKSGWGRVIHFGFHQAETTPSWENRAAYASAKVGLVSLTKTLALEEAEHGITVNMVCPGDIVQPWKERSIHEVRQENNDGTPVGRMGSGQDLSRVVSFLCEEDSDFLTGCVISVSGGKTSFI